jgi:hypothetical protein
MLSDPHNAHGMPSTPDAKRGGNSRYTGSGSLQIVGQERLGGDIPIGGK